MESNELLTFALDTAVSILCPKGEPRDVDRIHPDLKHYLGLTCAFFESVAGFNGMSRERLDRQVICLAIATWVRSHPGVAYQI